MAQAPDLKQALATGMQFTQLRREQAKQIAKDLLAQGQIARDQVATTVDELLELSRRRADELSGVVRQEVQRQLGALGLVTKEDLARVERRLGATTKTATKSTTAKKAVAKKAPAKKTAAKKPAAKATAKKTSGAVARGDGTSASA